MSYILDALKKIEQEKNRRNRADGRLNISGELYNERKRPAAQRSTLKIVIVIASVALLASGATWYLVKGKSKGKTTFSQMPVPPAAVPSQTAVARPAMPSPPPVISPPVMVPPTLAPAAPSRRAEQPPVRPVSAKQKPVKSVIPKTIKQEPIQTAPKAIVKKTPLPTIMPPAELKLSGIAWQDDHSSRRAVINGFLLKEGGAILGATIAEIQYDRVKFVTPEGRYEIRLDSIVPVEVKK